jgi:hypothetical protein
VFCFGTRVDLDLQSNVTKLLFCGVGMRNLVPPGGPAGIDREHYWAVRLIMWSELSDREVPDDRKKDHARNNGSDPQLTHEPIR